jgi:LysR family transcriptional regulator, low CO2-responsive transcriptional regulator
LDRVSITLTQLRSFLAVVRTGSVTAAADELVVTQPSVSAAVTALSRELGTSVLQRVGRGVTPTAAGVAFAPFAADVIGLLENGRRAAREAAAVAERGLRIAAVTTAAESFVPALMREFSILHPEIALTLSVGNRGEVLEMVLDHRADVAFGGRPPKDDRIDAHSLLPNTPVLIAAVDDPLVGRPSVAPALDSPPGRMGWLDARVCASFGRFETQGRRYVPGAVARSAFWLPRVCGGVVGSLGGCEAARGKA